MQEDDNMSDEFYRLLDWVVDTRILYTKYYNRVLTIERAVYIVSTLLTCSGVMGFLNSTYCPIALSSMIVLIGQALTIAYPHLPYTRRRYAIEYMLPKYRDIESQVETLWRSGCNDPQADYHNLLRQHEDAFRHIDVEYLGGEEIPFSKSLRNRADITKRAEMHIRFGVEPYDYKDAETGQLIRR